MKVITPFMIELHKDLKKSRELSDSTASQYIRVLHTLNSNLPFNNLSWLKMIEPIESRLAEYAESTQKTMISTIVSCLSTVSTKPTYKKVFSYWYNRMMESIHQQKSADTTNKSRKQEDNWLSWEVVNDHEKRLEESAEKVIKNKNLSVNDWNTILEFMVLSLYTKFPPRRNQDYQFMKVVKSEKEAKSTEFNYYAIKENKFIFNKYKTAKTHGVQIFDVPEDLTKIIKLYLSRHPNPKGMFLVYQDGRPLESVNAITRILNRIFGKSVGATMLRHIYLSSKYDVEEMNKDAEIMAHSSSTQHDYMKAEVPTINLN
jgi:integrase